MSQRGKFKSRLQIKQPVLVLFRTLIGDQRNLIGQVFVI